MCLFCQFTTIHNKLRHGKSLEWYRHWNVLVTHLLFNLMLMITVVEPDQPTFRNLYLVLKL